MTAPLAPNPNVTGSTLKSALNRGQVQSLPEAAQLMAFGHIIRSLPVSKWNQAPLAAAANPWVNATSVSLNLPDDAKALNIVRAYARVGTGTAAQLTVSADASTDPGAGDCSISPNGDILFHGADAWTAVDVHYQPRKTATAILQLSAASNSATLPTSQNGATAVYDLLMEVQSTAGTTLGNLKITAPASTNTTSGTACLNLAKTAILFDSADAVTGVSVKVGFAPPVNLDALLEATSPLI
jgi:hypothetical protein